MQDSNEIETIDLTCYNCYTSRNRALVPSISEIIELDDSFDDERNKFINSVRINPEKKKDNCSKKSTGREKKKSPGLEKKKSPRKEINKSPVTEKKTKKVGLCSICWDELGKKPLASTKCGHVYCLSCLEKSVRSNPRCPTCRQSLKGAKAYHPLYLELL